MKDLHQFAFDVSRCYLIDQPQNLPAPLFAKIHGWIRARDYEKLASCTDLADHASHGWPTFRALLQIEAFFKKNKVYGDDVSRSAACREAFFKAERLCRITNKRLDYYGCAQHRIPDDLRLLIDKSCSYISKVLGSFDEFLNDLPKLIRVTSGATLSLSRRDALPPLRLQRRVEVSPRLVPYFCAMAAFYGYRQEHWTTRVSNRVEEVPKSWKTNRTIACEPAGNVPFQLAFDQYAKLRIRPYGIDLADQTRNQALAYLGSSDSSFATCDLSMASDTVALNTVHWLFPTEWAKYLVDCRSAFASGIYGKFPYAKFSSMGNGSTFAIETLIFSAFCSAVGSRCFLVYGDDIVIEKEFVEDLKQLLKFFGFVLNPSKSHFDGPYRESCGKHWFKGMDVTPFYIRDLSKRKADWCHVVNGLARIAVPDGALYDLLAQTVKERKLPLGPYDSDSVGGVWIDAHTAWSRKLIRRRKDQTYRYKRYVPEVGDVSIFDTRSNFLWHLNANRYVHIPQAARESSRYTVPTSKYVRRWVYWFPPVEVTPIHLYWWSEYLVRRLDSDG